MNANPVAILYHAPTGTPAERIKQAAEYFTAKYQTAPNMAAIPRGWPIPQPDQVDGLRVVAAELPSPNCVIVGIAESEAE